MNRSPHHGMMRRAVLILAPTVVLALGFGSASAGADQGHWGIRCGSERGRHRTRRRGDQEFPRPSTRSEHRPSAGILGERRTCRSAASDVT